MISSEEARSLNYKPISLLKVCFKRRQSRFDSEGFTLKQAICYLEEHQLRSDDVCTTHAYYVFQQRVLIKDAIAFLYRKHNSIVYVYQKYKHDRDSIDLQKKTGLGELTNL
jgi:hypothetical protein